MKHKEIMMRLMALGMSTTIALSTPITGLAVEDVANVAEINDNELKSNENTRTSDADANGFVIENGVLVDYVGTDSEVVVPSTVKSVDMWAFHGCENVKKVTFSEGLEEINQYAFYACSNLEEVVFPNTLTTIGASAFWGCKSLQEVVIPDSVTTLGFSAFSTCENLKKVVLSKNIELLAGSTFFNCKSLTDVTIPDSVTAIQSGAFENCTSLEEIVIPENVKELNYGVFLGCSNLKKVTVLTSEVAMEEKVFGEASDTLKIYGYVGSDIETYATENGFAFGKIFTDIAYSNYYYAPVLWAVEKGITTGLSETLFGPEQSCTRAEVVTFLWRAMGSPEPSTTKNPFVDVNSNEYYYKAVLWALENSVTSGTDATHFAPDATITRAEIVTLLHRAKGTPDFNNATNPFGDVTNSDYYYDAVLWAVENNITTGLNSSEFGPRQSCTRGQVVTFLYRISEAK